MKYWFIVFSLICTAASAQVVRLVDDLAQGTEDGFSDDFYVLGSVGNSIVIIDRDQIIVSDGTAERTEIIGTIGTNAVVYQGVATIDQFLYFIIRNDESDFSLMELDVLGQQIRVVLNDENYIGNLINYKDELYCEMNPSTFTSHFVRVNTATGDVEEIFPMNDFGAMRDVIVHDDMIYSIHWSADESGAYLAKSDGTPGNVNEFKFLHDGNEFSQSATILMTSADDLLYFFYYSTQSNYALYVSDGTAEGTIVLEEDMDRIPFYNYDERRAIASIGNRLIFRGVKDGAPNDIDLWISDGTIEGTDTLRVADMDTDVRPEWMTQYNNQIYFYGAAEAGAWNTYYEVISTDGTREGTDVPFSARDHEDGLYSSGWRMVSHLGKLYFSGSSEDYDTELYSTEGTLETTERVSELAEGSAPTSIYSLVSAGENLFIFAETEELGLELYVYGAPIVNTEEVKVLPLTIHPNPSTTYLSIANHDLEYINILDTRGNVIRSSISVEQSGKIHVDDLRPGTYFIEGESNAQRFVGKFVKL